jgi:hypothetical protein
MTNDSSAIVQKVWNYPPSLFELRRTGAHVLKNAGVGYGDYVEVRAAQPLITYLLFLKLADEMTELGFDPPSLKLRRTGNPSDLQRVIKMIADEDWSGMGVDIRPGLAA